MPGNVGDARFNSYVLEHFYLWLTGKVSSFWSAGFFYPFPLTIAFSDNHLGNSFIHSALRMAGFDREDAFRGWFLAGFVVNYAACIFALSRLGYSATASALGGFLFTFGLPMMAQEGHAQLVYRFGVPLAVLALVEFARYGRLSSLLMSLFWTVWQFYCSIYIGFFLTLVLLAVSCSMAVLSDGAWSVRLSYWWDRLRAACSSCSRAKRLGFVAATIVLLLMMGYLVRPYLLVSQIYGFHRDWSEISNTLPRIDSYLLSTNSKLWNFSWSVFDALPLRPEHAMFIGMGPLLAIAVGAFLRRERLAPGDKLIAVATLAILMLVVVTIFFDGYSLYYLFTKIPGISSIRAVNRIGLVLLFPVAILTASSIHALVNARIPAIFRGTAFIVVSVIMVFECSYIVHDSSLKSGWQNRIVALAKLLPEKIPASPILSVAPIAGNDLNSANVREIDAMILAQDRGWRTLNGYSGNVPPGHAMTGNCLDASHNVAVALNFVRRDTDAEYRRLASQVVRIGYQDCGIPTEQLAKVSASAGPLPSEQFAKTAVKIDRIKFRTNGPAAEVTITNGGRVTIPAYSLTGTPIRISTQYVPEELTDPALVPQGGWESRQDLSVDVSPGQSQQFDVFLPPPSRPGKYRVAVSLVQDGVAWFHLLGMPIALSEPVTIPPAGDAVPQSYPSVAVTGGEIAIGAVKPGASGLLSGWHDIEPGRGAWMSKNNADFAFAVRDFRNPIRIKMNMTSILVDGANGYRILQGNQVIAEGKISGSGPLAPFETTFTATPDAGGIIELSIQSELMRSPSSLGINSDTRQIGLLFERLVLEPVAEKPN